MRKRRIREKKRWYVPIMVFVVIGVLGFQLFTLYSKLSGYREREIYLMQELEDAKAIEQELSDYEAYTKTDEYYMNIARTKLGLVKENEIVFKER